MGNSCKYVASTKVVRLILATQEYRYVRKGVYIYSVSYCTSLEKEHSTRMRLCLISIFELFALACFIHYYKAILRAVIEGVVSEAINLTIKPGSILEMADCVYSRDSCLLYPTF